MKDKFPILETQRLVLRQINDNDLENIYKGLSHPDVIKYYGISFTSLEATKEQMEWFANLEKTGTGIWWAICLRDDEKFLGAIGFNDLVRQHNKAEIGFWLLPDFWGKGIILETMPLVCDYAFNKLALHRIEANVDTRNTRCKNLLTKYHFSHEGTMYECEYENNEYISVDIFALLKPSNVS